MTLSIQTERMTAVPSFIAKQCIVLCHEDSEMQQLFRRIARQEFDPGDHACFIAYAWHDGATGVRVSGWASLTYWKVGDELRPSIQMYVALQYRSRSLATALCVCLHDEVTRHSLVCVFSDTALNIARRLGWRANQYRSVDDGWIGVGSTDGEYITGRHDSTGVHVAPSKVCSLSLACGEDGQDS